MLCGVALHLAERHAHEHDHAALEHEHAHRPVLGGLIYDSFSSYAWLFIGAFALGIGAFLSALVFTRLPSRPMVAATA